MKAANPSQALAVTLIDELARCGIRHACVAPGSRSAALAIALANDDRISVHISIDERSAAFMALGIARASGTPAIMLSTSGTATANFFPAIIEADASRVPMIVLTADRPPELRATGANQTIDQIKMYGDSVRWFSEVGVPEERSDAPSYWRSVACRAVAEAVGGPAGPVHLNLAMREPLVPEGDGFAYDLGGREDGRPWTDVSPPDRLASETVVARLVADLEDCSRPLIVAGDGAYDVAAVHELARAAGAPLFAEPLSNARSGPHAITTYDALLRTGWAREHRPDLVVRIGRVATSKELAKMLASDVRQVLVDPDRWWLDPGRTTSWMIAADVGHTLSAASGRLAGASSEWFEDWKGAEAAARSALDAVLDETDDVSEPRTARDLLELVPAGANVVVASSMPIRDLDWFMRATPDTRFFGNRGASGIDGFVSTALGVATPRDTPTFALAGDLSMLHDSNGLIGASSRGLDCTFVVLNNDGGGIFSFLPQARFPDNFERLFGTPHGVPFEKVAALHELGYARVEKASDLPAALEGTGVRIVEVRTDRTANVELHKRAWKAVADALG